MAGGLTPAQLDALAKQQQPSPTPQPAPTPKPAAPMPAPGGGLTPAQLDALAKQPGSGGSRSVAPPPTAKPTPMPQVTRRQAQKPIAPQGPGPVQQAEDRLRQIWGWLGDKGNDILTGVLGAPERGVGGITRGLQAHQDLPQILQTAWHDITTVDAQKDDTKAEIAALHGLTPDQIKAWVTNNHEIPPGMKPYVTGLLTTGEETLANMVFDPLTYVGIGDAVKAVKYGLTGLQHVGVFLKVAEKFHLPSTPFLKAAQKSYQAMVDSYAKWFHVRPDLDWMGKDAKAYRMQIERQAEYDTQGLHVSAQDVATPADAENRYLKLMWENGSPAQSAKANEILSGKRFGNMKPKPNPKSTEYLKGHGGNLDTTLQSFADMTPEERAKVINELAGKVESGRAAAMSSQFFSEHPELLKGKSVPDWSKIRTGRQARALAQKSGTLGAEAGRASVEDAEFVQHFRQLVQAGVFLNPLPHMVNISQLAYFAGGIRAVPDALQYMGYAIARSSGKLARLKNAGTIGQKFTEDVARLHAGGALPDYTRGMENAPYAKIPGLGAAWTHGVLQTQKALNEVETGWRVSLLRKLDRTLGPSAPGSKQELWKMHLVNQMVGDYENQTAFVNLFRAIGGPWVAFHLGIVPPAILRTIKDNPRRILLLARLADNTQASRTPQSQKANILNLPGTPLRAATNPIAYLSSPASLGLIEALKQARESFAYNDAPHVLAKLAGQYFVNGMTGGMARIATQAATGHGRPRPAVHGIAHYEPSSMTDNLMTAMLEMLGGYYSAQKSPQQLHAQRLEEKRMTRYRKNRSKEPLWETLLTSW